MPRILLALLTCSLVLPLSAAEEKLKSDAAEAKKSKVEGKEKPAKAAVRMAAPAPQEKLKNVDDEATHKHVREISVSSGAKKDVHRINAFALDAKGQILAACGDGPGQIRICGPDGELLKSWDVDFKPEAINSVSDGTILVGGSGKLVRYDSEGKVLTKADAPHVEALRSQTGKLREEAISRIKMMRGFNRNPEVILKSYERFVAQLEKKQEEKDLTKNEERVLASIKERIEDLKKQVEAEKGEEKKEEEISEKEISQQVDSMIERKTRIASISSDGTNVFIATYAPTGYRFQVWKLANDFTGGEVIINELSGCCGQMDVQCSPNGLYVAENSRHRVAQFSVTGEEIRTWGKRDRTGTEGFTSCCNPMNVCFGKTGDVYTAESNTGRIRRFTADGKFVSYVGDVKLVPGCKNVSIAVSPDGDRVYMLDLTRNHIVLMERQEKKAGEKTSVDATTKAEAPAKS